MRSLLQDTDARFVLALILTVASVAAVFTNHSQDAKDIITLTGVVTAFYFGARSQAPSGGQVSNQQERDRGP